MRQSECLVLGLAASRTRTGDTPVQSSPVQSSPGVRNLPAAARAGQARLAEQQQQQQGRVQWWQLCGVWLDRSSGHSR